MRTNVGHCLALAAVFAAGGCAHKSDSARAASTSARVVACATQSPAIEEMEPVAVLDFQDEAHGLVSLPATPWHENEVAALRSLARAVRGLRDASPDAAASIVTTADQIERSGGLSPIHQRYVKFALSQAVKALETAHRQHPDIPCFEERIFTAWNAIDRIDDETPLMSQSERVDNACAMVADAFPVGSTRMVVAGARSPYVAVREVRVNRYAWGLAGAASPIADRVCGAPALSVERHRTAGDVATSIATLGTYTPSHLRVTCPTSTGSR